MHCTHALLRLRFLDLSGIFSQIAIKAGHEFIVSVDDKYSKACDDRVMYVDYVRTYVDLHDVTCIQLFYRKTYPRSPHLVNSSMLMMVSVTVYA